jgi:hypothetical protein
MFELSLSGLFSLWHKLFFRSFVPGVPENKSEVFLISAVLRWSAHIRWEWGMGIHLQIDGNYNAHKTMTYKNSTVQGTCVLRSTEPTDSRTRLAIFRLRVTVVTGEDTRQYSVFSRAAAYRQLLRHMRCACSLSSLPAYGPWQVRPCHRGMGCPQAADGGTASNMEGSCEYIESVVADSRQGAVLQLPGGWGANKSSP